MGASRRALEERRAQAVGSLREVERRQAAGEIGDEEAAALIALFADRAALASAELDALGQSAPRRSPERLLPIAVVGAVLALTVLLVVVARVSGDDTEPPAEAPPRRDLSQVTNEEMEAVVGENPDVVPMRLALVERYLDDGQVGKANEHAAEAAERATGADDRHRANLYLGWTTALLGDPAEGVRLLREVVDERPDDLNARWFLARALADAGQKDEARALLESLLEEDMGPDQRAAIEQTLANL